METSIVLEAKEGYMFRRISDGVLRTSPMQLGKEHYIGGVRLAQPIDELPEHYEEIPIPPEMLEMMSNE